MSRNLRSREKPIFLTLSAAAAIAALGNLGSGELVFTRLTATRVDAEFSRRTWFGLFPEGDFDVGPVNDLEVDLTRNRIWLEGGAYAEYEIHGGATPENDARISKFYKTSAVGQSLRIPILEVPDTSILFGFGSIFSAWVAFWLFRNQVPNGEATSPTGPSAGNQAPVPGK